MSSRKVASNQDSVHEDLEDVVRKHLESEYKKPIRDFSKVAFESLLPKLESASSIILDSCCGVGESTIRIAKENPESLVVGIDKSEERLSKFTTHYKDKLKASDNAVTSRVDLFDFWKLFHQSGFIAHTHYLLYPNPWPKKQHLMRRVHGHPLFYLLPKISKRFILRTNWKIYADECLEAFKILGQPMGEVTIYEPNPPITPFERKYRESNQEIFQLNQVFSV